MWIITKIGFFNIIQYPEDMAEGLLTIKARSKEDLENVKKIITTSKIERSDQADYKFRVKTARVNVADLVATLVEKIDYRLTKPAISEHFPERSGIYFGVWDKLYEIQCLRENT